MLKSHSIALSAIAAALALPLALGSAQAAVIGSFDPAFGSTIPNLGFRGQITMELSAGCNGFTGYHSLDSVGYGDGSGCSIKATEAFINFYNSKSDPVADPLDPPTLAPLNRKDLTFADFGASYIYGAYFDATGMLQGIDTQHSTSFHIVVSDFSDPAYMVHYNDGYTSYDGSLAAGDLSLYFVSGFQFSECDGPCTFRNSQVTDPAFLDNTNGNVTTPSNPGTVTFATVPEPSGVALAGLGLAALIANRRRREKDKR